MQLKINKLFGERNYDLTLNEDLTILIGENGSGKSTITRILDNIIKNDLVSLSQIDFESIILTIPMTNKRKIIDIIDGKPYPREKLEIKILKEDIKQLEYAYDAKFKIILKKFLDKYDFEQDIESAKLDFDNFLKEFDNEFKNEKSNIKIIPPIEIDMDEDMKIFFDINKYSETKELCEDFAHQSEESTLINFLYNETQQQIDIPYGSKFYIKMLYLVFYKLKLLKIIDFKDETYSRDLLIESDSENKKYYTLGQGAINIFLRCSCLLNKNIDFSLFKEHYDTAIIFNNDKCYHFDKFDLGYKNIDKKRILLMYEYVHNDIVLLNNFYSSKIDDYVKFEDITRYKAQTLISENKLLELINHLCDKINDKAIVDDKIMVLIKENYTDEQIEKYKSILNLIKNYIEENSKIKEHFKKIDFDKYIDLENKNTDILKSLKMKNYTFGDWIFELSKDINQAFVENRNVDIIHKSYIFNLKETLKKMDDLNILDFCDTTDIVKNFNDLTNKYFSNKEFIICYDSNGYFNIKIYDKKTGLELIKEKLSSGEYKILRLIKRLVFTKNKTDILVLDEPELSLSIYWQNMLIDDILKYRENKTVIIATQSTSLVKENHYQYLKEVEYSE